MIKTWRDWDEETRSELRKVFKEAEEKREEAEAEIEKEEDGLDEYDAPTKDMRENPENYYIWRCVGDSKVRSSHAERDGEVFCWDNPPEGGHPGEDYNCRCRAEEYKVDESEVRTKREYDNIVLNMASALMQGVSLGYADEIHGMMSGLGYGLGSLNSNWNKKEESFSEAYKRGYEEFRDNHRDLVKYGYEKHPVVMTVSEVVGAMSSPVNVLFGAAKMAPLRIKSTRDLIGNLVSGIAYGVGVSEGDVMDYIINIVAGVGGGLIGHAFSKQLYGRGAGATTLTREFINQMSGTTVNTVKNLFSNK